MTTYTLTPIPIWYFTDLNGKPLAGGSIETLNNDNPSQKKDVYQTAAGPLGPKWTNPISLDGSGSATGPFYWADDVLYTLIVRNSAGNTIRTIEDYGPGTGGGAAVTVFSQINNMLVNNNFTYNCGSIAANVPATVTLAPSSHAGFLKPDITFFKDAITAVDTITFPLFPQGSTALTPDATPLTYLEYNCSNAPVGENNKYIQFPLTPGVKNLEGQTLTLKIWAQNGGGNTTLNVGVVQYFGDGSNGPSAEVPTNAIAFAVTGTWAPYVKQITLPNIAAKTIGNCGTDGLYFRIYLPAGSATIMDIAKPAVYLGAANPTATLDTVDQTNSIISAPRPGDNRIGYNGFPASGVGQGFGWVPMDDGSIGNGAPYTASGATTRANPDTVYLYAMMYLGVSDTYAPVSGGRSGADLASALNDFALGKRLTLTKQLGRAIAGIGLGSGLATNYALGQTAGAETSSGVGSHTHSITSLSGSGTANEQQTLLARGTLGPNLFYNTIATGAAYNPTVNVTSTGNTDATGAPFSIVDPRIAVNVYAKL